MKGSAMQHRQLGQSGLEVSAIGLGCMTMIGLYGASDDGEATATIHRAPEIGVNFIDTSDAYARGTNETFVGQAIKGRREAYVVATKFGNLRLPDGKQGVNGRPDYVMSACEASLQRLGIDVIDLYYQHRVDPETPIEDTVGAMARLVEQGKVRYLGLSEASVETVRRAHAVHPIAALQTEYSLWSRDVEDEILPTCRELGIGFVPYSPLGRGFLTGRIASLDDLEEKDRRRDHPRFHEDNLAQNQALLAPIRALALEKGREPVEIALAWVLAKGPDIVPIPGAKRRDHLEQNAGAVDLELSAEDVARLDDALPSGGTAGTRYPAGGMKRVNI
jgi:aryl-alcohol dehydrogenase-like predicted oxidoreductase